MYPFDHVFVLLIFVALPIYSAVDTRRYLARVEAGQPANRVRFCVETAMMQWVLLAALGVAWWILGRPIAALGFRPLEGVALWGGTLVLALIVTILAYGWHTTKQTSDQEKLKQVNALGRMAHFLPRTTRELRYFFGLAITAGIVEEILYRAFALWYLGLFMPLWLAVGVSSLGFGLLHIYQGVSGAVRAGIVGLGFAIFYVLTGSVWLPILAHIALDVLQGMIAIELFRKRDDAAAAPAHA